LTEFALVVCLCVYLPDDNLVEVETCMNFQTMQHTHINKGLPIYAATSPPN